MLSLKTKTNLPQKDLSYLRIARHSKRHEKIIKKRERKTNNEKEKQTMRKSQTTRINISLLLLFLYRKIYFLLENIFGETQFILLDLYYSLFTWQVIGNAVKNTNNHIDMHWSCRRRT